jgi:predicted acylesterase/phospholipase RssA
MIAGTSIGSWNAMFWLAGLVKPPAGGGLSAHEAWWRSIRLSRIVEFDQYLPLRSNHFVRPTPWREAFGELFIRPESVRARLAGLFDAVGPDGHEPIHFYFTRSNVARGHLEFATNRESLRRQMRPRLSTPDPTDEEPVVPTDRYEVIEGPVDAALPRLERAVFASMDLPPLFPYVPIKVEETEHFEDGGVVENLPVRFGTQIEPCDLLFVLPLNASFAEPVNHTSVVNRLTRVMDVRQGVIERHAMKLSYLYNELAALRGRVAELETPRERKSRDTLEMTQRTVELESTALRREHQLISLFAICPEPPLGIGTTQFWKPKEAGEAFELMYAATRYELAENFKQATNPHWVRMTLVGPQGQRRWTDDF